jgi:peptidyl-dipeptidase Dcp
MGNKTLRPSTEKLSQVVTLIVTGIMAIGTTQTPVYAAETDFGPSNPFYAESTLPFHAPPFDKINATEYPPAIEAGMAKQREEVNAIANDPAAPTFENTIVAMEDRTANRDAGVNAVTGAN